MTENIINDIIFFINKMILKYCNYWLLEWDEYGTASVGRLLVRPADQSFLKNKFTNGRVL